GLSALEHLQRQRLARLLGRRARARGLRVGARQGLALWRGVGTKAALRGAGRLAGGAAREARLRVRPVRIAPGELEKALGGADPVEALRGRVLAAMQTVARFEDQVPPSYEEL